MKYQFDRSKSRHKKLFCLVCRQWNTILGKGPYSQSSSSPTGPILTATRARREIPGYYLALNMNQVQSPCLLWLSEQGYFTLPPAVLAAEWKLNIIHSHRWELTALPLQVLFGATTAVVSLGCLITAIYSPAYPAVLGFQHRLSAQIKTLMRCKVWLHNSLTSSTVWSSRGRETATGHEVPAPNVALQGSIKPQPLPQAPAVLDELNSPFLSGCYPDGLFL